MIKHARSVRINGSASLDLAYVACGRLDAYCDTGLFPWDISAARLLIAEAGGAFVAYGEGTLQSQFCIGSNGRIQDELQRLVLV
jgi:myo-inositol-1(or 4)-monophosphatase